MKNMTVTRISEHNKMQARGQATVRVGPLMSIPAILREHGCDPGPILDSLGFKLSQFEDPDLELPFIPTSQLIAACVEATKYEHFGLLMGMCAQPSSLGIAGFMLRTAHDVDTALHALKRHLDLHDQGGVITLTTDGEFTSLGYAVHLSGVSASAQIYDMSIVLGCKIMRNLCGEDWNPTKVLLSRPPPRDPAPYDSFFKAPIRFNATGSAVVFPARWLQHKLPSHDLLLFDYLERKAAELHRDKALDLVSQLHRFLRIALVTQDCSASAAAQHLGIHERTLNRRLQEQGTTFRDEVNEVRYAMAQSFLANSEASNAEIALALGYTDATTFGHAFKRWSGMTPAQWRKRHT
jgi:AraC-like DNA-binding protein